MGQPAIIGSDVVILTRSEYEQNLRASFLRGVERGKFESLSESNQSQNREPDGDPSRTGLRVG